MFRFRSRSKRVVSVKVDYTVYINEVNQWPPCPSLESVKSIVLHWSNGVRSGSIQSTAFLDKEGIIEFKESFKLPVTLSKDVPVKGQTDCVFHKNFIELNIYELRNKSSKGPLIASAQVDLAEHGVIKETELDISVPMNCRKTYKCTTQPVLSIIIRSFDSQGLALSPNVESVVSSDSMSERKLEEIEVVSFTDDDFSRSSLDISGPPSEENFSSPQTILNEQLHQESEIKGSKKISEATNTKDELPKECVSANTKAELEVETCVTDVIASFQNESSSLSPSLDFCDRRNYEEAEYSPSSVSSMPSRYSEEFFGTKSNPFHERNQTEMNDKFVDKNIGIHGDTNHPTELEDTQTVILLRKSHSERRNSLKEMKTCNDFLDKKYQGCKAEEDEDNPTEFHNSNTAKPQDQEKSVDHEIRIHDFEMVGRQTDILPTKPSSGNIGGHGEIQELDDFLAMKHKGSQTKKYEGKTTEVLSSLVDVKPLNTSTQNDVSSSTSGASLNLPPRFLQHSHLKSSLSHVFTQKLVDKTTSKNGVGNKFTNTRSMRNIMSNIEQNTWRENLKENDGLVTSDGDNINHYAKNSQMYEKKRSFSERMKFSSISKIRDLEHTVQMLKEELIETASIELSLHSIVAEHGSSVHKVHTPARRLSRMYIHASKKWSSERKANAARSAVSGLILATKACGNDISRLTFWLSNAVTLRAIITLANSDPDIPSLRVTDEIASDSRNGWNVNSPRLKWKSESRENIFLASEENFDDWEEPNTVTKALEKIEAWMFSRIVESVWWQILTPHMQSTNGSEQNQQINMDWQNPNNFYGRNIDKSHQQAENSIKIWAKAFKDVQAKLCPVRADGHECGCLPMLSRLAMEQCVKKLDVVMFNAILRESDDDIPTDPISDPITDPKVLPIPVGKTSFNSGALLKNAVGNWSRGLCDIFGIDESLVGKKDDIDDDERQSFSILSKPFILLNALSNLLMIPKHTLLQNTVRKRLCPVFSGRVIRQILNNFVPDEFCSNSISDDMLQALGYEEPVEVETDVFFVKEIPCKAARIVYSPPSIASITSFVGDAEQKTLLRKSGTSIIHKYHGSDDELDEVESLFDKVVLDRSSEMLKENGHPVLRYKYLREVWSNDYMLRI